MNSLGPLLTLVGMVMMLVSVWRPRAAFDDSWCDTAAALRHAYRLPRRIPTDQRDAIAQLHTIQ